MSSDSSSPTELRTDRPNPLSRWRRRVAGIVTIAVVVLTALGSWALRPIPDSEWHAPTKTLETPRAAQSEAYVAVDCTVFERSLWTNLARPGSPDSAALAKEKPKELPLEIDLIGISEVSGILVAALYDRRADRLVLAKSGESIAGAKVAEVTREQVTLQRGNEQKVLVRRRPGS